jgi:hypothetical protein
MRSLTTLIALLFLLACSAGAQSTAGADIVATKDDVMNYLNLLHVRDQLTRYLAGVSEQAKLGAEAGFKQKVPNATPDQLAKIDKFAENIFKDMPVDEMIDVMVPIYQKHLTKGDLDSITAFYATPVGQKLLREQPAMTQEAMQAGGEIGRKRIGAMGQKVDEFVKSMAQEAEKKDGNK